MLVVPAAHELVHLALVPVLAGCRVASRGASLEFFLVARAETAHAVVLQVGDLFAGALLALALLRLQLVHLLLVALAVERDDFESGEVGRHEVAELVELFRVRTVRSTVVVDDEFVVGGVFAGRRLGRFVIAGFPGLRRVVRVVAAARDGVTFGVTLTRVGRRRLRLLRWIRALLLTVMGTMMFESPDEEFPTEGDIDTDVAMHGVFAEQVDAKFLSRLGEPKLGIQGQDIGEYAATFVIVHKVKERLGHFKTRFLIDAVLGVAVVIVDSSMLVVKGAI